jgi:uncharacterized protein YjbJ (UPF0337 family)
MDNTFLEGKWNQIRGKTKGWWSRLTDNDLDQIAGKFDILVNFLQRRYGFSRRYALKEISLYINEDKTGIKK